MELPSSPGTRDTVEISRCMEELLKFTLESDLNQTLELELGLSRDFCSRLLKDVPLAAESSNEDSKYPLYKYLASALHECITRGESCQVFNDDDTLEKSKDWNQFLVKEGSELVNLLRTIDFELHVQEPFFTQIRDGEKTVEGRCAAVDYNRIGCGALILFNKCLVFRVQDVCRYASFSEMLIKESLTKVLPGVKTIDEGVQVYRKFYTEEKEKANGVVAISIIKLDTQPYLYLARILSGLSYEGLQSLLSLIHPKMTI